MHALIVAGVVALVTVGWSLLNRRRAPLWASGNNGTISPGKVSAALVTALGLGVLWAGAHAAVAGQFKGGLGWAAAGGLLILFMAPSLTHRHDVIWTDEGVQGPSRLFGPSLWLSRTSIAWHDIGAVGATITSYWFIESNDGRRIYWSYLYPGYGSFTRRLRTKRPDLNIPSDLG